MTRIVLGGLAACWLAVGLVAWRNHRRDVARHMPVRWRRAVATLDGLSAIEDDGPPVAATWCRPMVQPVMVAASDLPQQRSGAVDAPSAASPDRGRR